MRQMMLLILRADPGVENNDSTKKDLREHQGCQENSLLEEIMSAIHDYAMRGFEIFRMPGLNRVTEENFSHERCLHTNELPVKKHYILMAPRPT
jgi:hypothetical protein